MLAFEAVLLYELILALIMVSPGMVLEAVSIIARRFAKGADAKIRIDSWIFGLNLAIFISGRRHAEGWSNKTALRAYGAAGFVWSIEIRPRR